MLYLQKLGHAVALLGPHHSLFHNTGTYAEVVKQAMEGGGANQGRGASNNNGGGRGFPRVDAVLARVDWSVEAAIRTSRSTMVTAAAAMGKVTTQEAVAGNTQATEVEVIILPMGDTEVEAVGSKATMAEAARVFPRFRNLKGRPVGVNQSYRRFPQRP